MKAGGGAPSPAPHPQKANPNFQSGSFYLAKNRIFLLALTGSRRLCTAMGMAADLGAKASFHCRSTTRTVNVPGFGFIRALCPLTVDAGCISAAERNRRLDF